MGVIKDRHGTYYVQQRVPERLQEAVARVLGADETRRVFLKKSLGTKNLKEAKAAAPHVLTDFGRIIGQAEALLKEQPVVTVLTDAQIKRMTVNKIRTTDLSNRLHDQHSNLGSHENGSQCGPSVPGSRLDADHPENGVLIPCRNTGMGSPRLYAHPRRARGSVLPPFQT